jgi:hypothetical protein
MKLRLKLTLVTLILSLLISGGVQAQGIYSKTNDNKSSETSFQSDNSTSSSGVYGSGPSLRDDSDPWGGDGNDRPTDPGSGVPVGEGFLILSFLSGVYAIVKRNLKNKHEN